MTTLIGEMIATLAKKPEDCAVVGLDRKQQRNYGNSIRANLVATHRFHLSSKTAEVASSLCFNAKDAASVISLARAPFPLVWLEWNLVDQMRGIGQTPLDDATLRIGTLVSDSRDGQLMITLIIEMEDGSVMISPISLLFDPNKPLDKTIPWLRNHRYVIAACAQKFARIIPPGWDQAVVPDEVQMLTIMDTLMVGGQANPDGTPTTPQQQTLIDHASWTFTPYFSDVYQRCLIQKEDMKLKTAAIAICGERLVESNGYLRFVIGALALLNSQKFVTRTSIKPTDKKAPPEAWKPKSSKKSPIYEFVEFTAPHKVFIRDIIEDATQDHEHGPKKAQHEVVAHFAHSRKVGDPNCNHDYQPNGDNTRWICLNCGNKRWRRKSHLRGDPSIGIITHKERLVLS